MPAAEHRDPGLGRASSRRRGGRSPAVSSSRSRSSASRRSRSRRCCRWSRTTSATSSLYGWVFSAYLLAALVGTVVAGREADRRGPGAAVRRRVRSVRGRAHRGWARADDAAARARPRRAGARRGRGARGRVRGRSAGCYPPAVRPRMFAVLSTAWVVPALAGPALAGLHRRHVRLALGVPRPRPARRGRGRDHDARRCCTIGPVVATGPARRRAARRPPGRTHRATRCCSRSAPGLVIGGLTASETRA